jgi:hypothetical protein
LKSCEYNKKYDFIFFTDIRINEKLPENVKIQRFTLNDFTELVQKQTKIKPSIEYGWKICDFKPAYGFLFNEFIYGYNFWGIIDIDIIFGKIEDFITEELLNKYDIISALKFWLSGSFAIFRNTKKVNELFMQSKDWKRVFVEPRHFAFDECGRLINDKGEKVYQLLKSGKKINEIKTDIESFTHVLFNERKSDGLKLYFKDMNCEKLDNKMIIKFNNGDLLLYNRNLAKEILYYHFVNDKNNFTFNIPKWKNIPDTYFVTNYIFTIENDFRLKKIKFLFSYFKGAIKFFLIKKPIKVLNKMSMKIKLFIKNNELKRRN